MRKSIFYKLGVFIYHCRWVLFSLWLLMIIGCIPFLPNIVSPFKTTGFVDENSDSAKAEQFLNKKLGYDNNNKFVILYTSKTLLVKSAAFQEKINESLADLKHLQVPHEIILPDHNKKLISKDKHTTYAVVILKGSAPINDELIAQFKSLLKKPSDIKMTLGGEPIFVEDVNQQTQDDLYRADFIATPVSIVVLILIFGSLFAAFLPIVLGGGCALIILTILYFLGHAFNLSIFTLNIALLLGLCLSLDYSLFIISRFRDELKSSKSITEAIAITQATAGKAIFFSGLTVFASLSALLFFPITILFSVAIGGLTAVIIAVFTAIVVLPAILAIVKNKINFLSIRVSKLGGNPKIWGRIAHTVVRRPYIYFVGILALLLTLGYPFIWAKFGVSDFRILPEDSGPRHFYTMYTQQFDERELTPILLVVKTTKPIISQHNIKRLYDLTNQLKKNPLIKEVNGLIATDKSINSAQYYALYHENNQLKDKNVKQLLNTTTREYLTLITLVSKYPVDSPQTKRLIQELRALKAPAGMSYEFTGVPVSNHDLLAKIGKVLPYALAWIFVVTYLILMVLLRSIFLPLKAILMNILSLCACYGALVLIFQLGYLHKFLNFEPQGVLDISLLVIIFCALFGFSMDYEVFLLSRIKEHYEKCKNSTQSIIVGIEKSCNIITSAALIVICICFSFLVADVLMVKAFGLGIAVAIFVDAFLIRVILVPSTMVLMQKWNWYLPKWLDKILPKL